MRRFASFACVDWSGQAVERPKGIAVALARATGPPVLLSPERPWSRTDVLDWLRKLAGAKADVVIGFDLSPAFPFEDQAAYFPGWAESPLDAKALWALVDRISRDDPHLSASAFVRHVEGSRYFRHSKDWVGDRFGTGVGRLRRVEHHQRRTKQANSASCFNLIGATQVGKSSLTGMRLLHQLGGAVPIWPFDSVPEQGPLIVEVYTSIAARAANVGNSKSKVRSQAELDDALRALGSPIAAQLIRYDDHSTDALVTAAWLRRATMESALWRPASLTPEIARTEGWTFGVL